MSGGCGKPGHVTEEVVDVISRGLDANNEHLRQLFERVYNEALERAAQEAANPFHADSTLDLRDDIAARIRALKAQKAPH